MFNCLNCRLTAAVVLTGSLALGAVAAQAETVTMESTSSASLAGLLPQTWATFAARDGVDVQLALGQTLTKSLLKIAVGQINSAVVPPPAYLAMKAGKGPYAKMGDKAVKASGNVRSLFGFFSSSFHTIVWADSGIETWDDIKGKKVFIGPPAGAANMQITGMIEAASGLKEGSDYTGVKVPWGAAQQGFQDGQYDVYVAAAGIGQQSIVELSLQRAIRLLPMPAGLEPETRLQLVTDVVPPNTYSGQVNGDVEVPLWSTTMMLAVQKDMAEDTAYKLTKSYWTNLDEMKAGNAVLRSQNAAKPFVGVVAPLHPGALRYYKEAGINVPSALAAQ